MSDHLQLFAALAAPFEAHELKVLSKGSKQVTYITARVAMNRFDDVLGPHNWRDSYTESGEGLRCRIEVRIPGTAEWLWKEDGGGSAGMSDGDDDEKSAYSSAFKRAAVKWGVGRYLYRDGVPKFARESQPLPPAQAPAPAAATAPASLGWVHGDHDATAATAATLPPTRVNGAPRDGDPRTGKALYSWVKDREQEYEVGLLKYLNQWARLQEFPGRMVEWDGAQVALAVAEARRKLGSLVRDREEVGAS